jgi:hypothetical protein
MAGPAVISLHVVRCLDGRSARLHSKGDIHVTEPASELCPMKPVIEYHRRETGFFRVVVQDDPAILKGQRPPLFHACLRQGHPSNSEDQDYPKENLFHKSSSRPDTIAEGWKSSNSNEILSGPLNILPRPDEYWRLMIIRFASP